LEEGHDSDWAREKDVLEASTKMEREKKDFMMEVCIVDQVCNSEAIADAKYIIVLVRFEHSWSYFHNLGLPRSRESASMERATKFALQVEGIH